MVTGGEKYEPVPVPPAPPPTTTQTPLTTEASFAVAKDLVRSSVLLNYCSTSGKPKPVQSIYTVPVYLAFTFLERGLYQGPKGVRKNFIITRFFS